MPMELCRTKWPLRYGPMEPQRMNGQLAHTCNRHPCRSAAFPRWSANGSKASPMATRTSRGAASLKARMAHGTRLWVIRGRCLVQGGSESALKPLGYEFAFHWSAVQALGQPRRLLAMRFGLPQPVGRGAELLSGGVQLRNKPNYRPTNGYKRQQTHDIHHSHTLRRCLCMAEARRATHQQRAWAIPLPAQIPVT